MKKFGRTIWIGILAGFAFLSSCGFNRGLSKTDRANLEHQRDSIRQVLKSREGACVYGSPEIIQAYSEETQRLQSQLNEINARLGDDKQKK